MNNSPNAFCSACGGALSAGDTFCGRCGVALPTAPTGAISLGSAIGLASEQAVDTSAVPTPPTVAPTTPTPNLPVIYASFIQRVAATLVDLGILFAAFLAVSFGIGIVVYTVMPESAGDQFFDSMSEAAYTAIFLIIWVIYRPLLWQVRDGQSFGQALAKIRVRTKEEERMSFANGLGRQAATGALYAFFWPVLMAIDVLWMTWDKSGQRQTLHDKIANTIVVQAKTKDAR
jgi:uncharacterized RDD family membrane protein YckC